MPFPPRLELALVPTPILKLDRLSRELGVELYVKRDDLTGLLESGNMARKLEFLAGEALSAGADTLVVCGTADSNCCRAVAAVAARLGLRAIVVVKGARPEVYDGNLLLDRLLGAELRFLDEADPTATSDAIAAVGAEVRAAGGRPYLVPESGSDEVGALGYLECAVELAGQISHGAPRFDAVVITAFTGGSQAGLLMGKQLAGLPSEIVGVPVGPPAEHVRNHVSETIARAIRRFGFAIEVPKAVHLLDRHPRAGAADLGDEEIDALVHLGHLEGLLLDPLYTARALGGLLATLRRDRQALGQRVCFVHTGGLFSLFPLRGRLSRRLDDIPVRARA